MKVSIGIPFFNNADTLENAIRSVFAQTFQDWELILLDDGSSDDSLAIARSIKDQRVKVISDGQNYMLAHRLNQLTALSRGEYIARMDADDMMHPERLERQCEFLDRHQEIDVLGTGLVTIDGQNQPVGMRGCESIDLTPDALLTTNPLAHPTIMVRAQWSRANQYQVAFSRAQDFELWCRTCRHKSGTFSILPLPLLFYREKGSIRLDKIMSSHACVRSAIRLHGPELVGWLATVRLLAMMHVKSAIWRLAAWLQIEEHLVSRRSSRLAPSEETEAAAVLQTIMRTSVPGLSNGSHRKFDRKAA